MVITTAGLEIGNDAGLDVFDSVLYVGFGTGTTAPKVSDTTLETEVGERVAVSGTKSDGDDKYTFTFRVPLSLINSYTITEIGLFDSLTDGNMFTHSILNSSYTKSSDDELLGTIKIKIQTKNN